MLIGMNSKPTPASRQRRTASASASAQPGASSAVRAHATPVFELSFDVEPVVSVIRRHVKLSKAADAAITQELVEVLGHAIVQFSASGKHAPARRAVSAPADDPVLTTEQAAQRVGVSRPYMAKLIDTGAVPLHQMVGNQRRVLLSAVAQWQQNERARQAEALKRVARDLDEEIFSS